MAAYQYIYTMKDLRKVFPNGKEVLKGIYLSFFPGAKIGVLGANGAGKSTLAEDHGRRREGVSGRGLGGRGRDRRLSAAGARARPEQDRPRQHRGGGRADEAVLARFEEVSMKLGEPMSDAEMNRLLAEQAELQDKIDAGNGWELDRTLEIAMDALRCPPGDADVTTLSRRRAAPGRAVPAAAAAPGPAAARRADQPSRRRERRLARALPAGVPGHGGGDHPRPLLPRQRRRVDPRARPRHGIPWKGNYSSWLDQKRKRLAQEEKAESNRQRTLARELEWVQMSPKARQAKSKARVKAYETCWPLATTSASTPPSWSSRSRVGSATRWSRPRS
jgi:sulfate-transporting ATPase